jgi:hypothetical protein
MTILISLLDPNTEQSCPAVQSAVLLLLVSALLENSAGMRVFEQEGGLERVVTLVKGADGSGNKRNGGNKRKEVDREVRRGAVEFLYFYLMPECLPVDTMGGKNAGGGEEGRGRGDWKSTEEKQRWLGRWLDNVEDLVEDLRESACFVGY